MTYAPVSRAATRRDKTTDSTATLLVGRPAPRRASGGSPLVSRITVNIVLLVFALYTLLPVVWLMLAATKNTGDLLSTPGFAFAEFNLFDNLVRLFTIESGIYLRWLGNTFLYAVVGSMVSVAVSFLAGYAFDKFDFPGKERWFGFVLIGVLVPAAVTTMPLYLLAANVGIINTFWGVFLPLVASPFGVYLARIFSNSYVPNEVVEAARIDGAGELRIFASIVAPLMRPGVVTLLLLSFSSIWNNFFLPLVMLTDRDLFPVALGLYAWNGQAVAEPSMSAMVITGSLVAMLPVIGLFLGLQRFWQAGIGAGAVK